MKYITKNGFKPLLIFLVLGILFTIMDVEFLELLTFSILVLLAIIYRKPNREIIEATSILTSPIDGVVVGIDKLENQICIRIEKSIFTPSAISAPTTSNISSIDKRNGLYLNNASALSKKLNETYSISLSGDKNIDMKITPSTLSLDGVKLYVLTKDKISIGEEIGFLMQGEIDIFLDNTALLKINIGDDLKSSQSIIASI